MPVSKTTREESRKGGKRRKGREREIEEGVDFQNPCHPSVLA
jgi:hypothetical protein